MGNPHLVEAGFDGFRLIDLVATSNQDLLNNNSELDIFPNPSQDQFNVKFKVQEAVGPVQLNIYSQLGQQLSSQSINQKEGLITLGAELPAGIYLIQLLDQNGSQITKRLIKQ